MATEVRMPKLGMTMEEGTVQVWFKQEGDTVQKGEPLLSVLTDKVDIEVDAPASGVLHKILVPAGQTVPINTPIAIIAAEGEVVEPGRDAVPAGETRGSGGKAAPPGKVRATPVARRLAAQWGLDLAAIPGSGPKGRVTRADVEAFAASRQAAALPAEAFGPAAVAPAAGSPPQAAVPAGLAAAPANAAAAPVAGPQAPVAPRRIPLSGMRRVIGERMSQSAFTAPHVTLTTEADVTDLVRLRTALNEEDRRHGGPGIGYLDLFVRIAARALLEHPYMNARLEGDELVLEPEAHVGVAVALPDGLLVPVIRHASRLSVGAIARERHRLVQAARNGTLSPDDLHGGTFTITNLGAYEIDAFTPIINPPQAAILGMGRVVEKPAVHNGQVAIRSMMALSLSFDHRIVDGAPAAAFLQRIKQLAERPELLHL